MSRQPELGQWHAAPGAPDLRIKSVALMQLIAVLTLALSTLIAATAVSIGLARADATPTAGAYAAPFATTLSPRDGMA